MINCCWVYSHFAFSPFPSSAPSQPALACPSSPLSLITDFLFSLPHEMSDDILLAADLTHPHFEQLVESKWSSSTPGSREGRSDWFNSREASSTLQSPLAKGCELRVLDFRKEGCQGIPYECMCWPLSSRALCLCLPNTGLVDMLCYT